MTTMTKEQLEAAILLNVVRSFSDLKQSTTRRALVIKFKNQPAAYTINELVHQNVIRRKNTTVATTDEEYLPAAAAFELCGDNRLREEAKHASTVVLHTLQNMFVGEQKKEGFGFQDLKRHVEYLYTNQIFDDATLKLGLYLARDLGALMGNRLSQRDETEVEWFQIAESAANMPNPESEWDRVMAGFKRPFVVAEEPGAPGDVQWEQIRCLGGGGQSDVFLVRSPERVTQRAACLRTIRTALDQDKRADLADAMWSYSRPLFSFLHLRRGWIEPAGEHYGLGVGGVSEAVQGRVDYEVGHLSLCVWSAASSGVSGEVRSEFEAGVAAGAFLGLSAIG